MEPKDKDKTETYGPDLGRRVYEEITHALKLLKDGEITLNEAYQIVRGVYNVTFPFLTWDTRKPAETILFSLEMEWKANRVIEREKSSPKKLEQNVGGWGTW